jgi:hypothetical protein
MCETATEQPIASRTNLASKEFLGLHHTFPVFTLIVKKVCTKCGVEKPLEMFAVDSTRKDGRYPSCKGCRKKYLVVYKATYQSTIIDGNKVYYKKNRASIRKKQAVYRVENIESVSAAEAKWQRENRPRINARYNNRIKTDPVFYLKENVRKNIQASIKEGGKSGKTNELVGLSGKDLLDYLGTLFWPGMTKDNRGNMKWHLDHVVPIESFDKSDPNWQFKAFHWTNLQPLWADDNLRKSNRLDWSPSESIHKLPERFYRETKTYWKVVV